MTSNDVRGFINSRLIGIGRRFAWSSHVNMKRQINALKRHLAIKRVETQ